MSRQNKTSLTPIHEIYNRLRWDPRFELAHFTIQYQERSGALKDKPLTAWNPEGDVPWHRVRQLRYADLIVWDREARIERLDDLLNAHSIEQPPAPSAQLGQQALTTWRFEPTQQDWFEHSHQAARQVGPRPHRLRVATINALFDRHDPEGKLQTPTRLRALISALDALDADLIILTEITPTMIEQLLDAPCLQETYFASDGPLGEHLDPYGQLILSKYDASFTLTPLQGHKTLLSATIPFHDGPLQVAAIHLLSNATEDAPTQRELQLQTALSALKDAPELILAGDLNLQEGELASCFDEHDLLDAWPSVHGATPGYTFDPDHNALAKAHSRRGTPSRYDRLYLRSSSLNISSASIFAQEPILDALPISDHYGLLTTITASAHTTQHDTPTVQSAAILPIPKRLWPQLQEIRREHDRSFERWMPHINLLYPFLPERSFSEAHDALAAAIAQQPIFETTLSRVEHFSHQKSFTVWIGAQDEQPIKQLQRALEAAAPQCQEQSQRGAHGFTPHLTIARFDHSAHAQLHHHKAQWQHTLDPLSFPVTEIALISRDAKTPFTIKRRIPLSLVGAPQATIEAQLGPSPTAPQALLDAISQALSPTPHLLLTVGSQRHQTAIPSSDLDLLLISHQPAAQLAQTLTNALPPHVQARAALDATIPTIKLRWQTSPTAAPLHADITLATYPEPLPRSAPHALSPAQLTLLGPTDALAANGDLMAQLIFEEIETTPAPSALREAIRFIKAWATQRGIIGSAYGFWSSTSWSLATTWAAQSLFMRQSSPPIAAQIIQETFARLSQWPWPAPLPTISTPLHYHSPDAHMPVPNPTHPTQNTARGMTPHSAQITQAELQRARRLITQVFARQEALSALLIPYELKEAPHQLTIKLSAPSTPKQDLSALAQRLGLKAQLALPPGALPMRPSSLQRPSHNEHTLGLQQQPTIQQQRHILAALQRDNEAHIVLELDLS